MPNEIVSQKKAMLAKLLAQENLTIEFQNVATASFNIKTRMLTLPNMRDDLSPELYNLFIGHEVGHALFTPEAYGDDSINIPDSLKSGNKNHDKMIEQNLKNILEDVRIERKIQQKYPGLKRDFRAGYEELLANDFFKIKGKDVNSMGFLNRLNLYAKCGVNLGVQFSPEEQVLVEKAFQASSYNDMVAACQEVIDYVASKKEDPNSADSDINTDNYFNQSGNEDGDPSKQGFGSNAIVPPKDQLYKKPPATDKEFDPNVRAEGSDIQITYDDDESPSDDVDSDLDISTNSELDDALKGLFEQIGKDQIVSYQIPQFVLQNVVVDNTTFRDAMIKSVKEFNPKVPISQHNLSLPYKTYKTKNTPIIRFMVKEFELRKRAKELQKEQPYKTGRLDVKRAYKYQLTNDIFRTGVYQYVGKSHGLVLFIDWSGSMDEYLHDSVCQLFCLTDFCRAIGVPFDVYAFRSGVKRGLKNNVANPQVFQTVAPSYLDLHNFHLVHMLSSDQSFSDYVDTQKHLVFLVENKLRNNENYLSTESTPLNNAIVAAMQIVPEFQRKYKLEIVNSIFITDGGSDTTTTYFTDKSANRQIGNEGAVAYITDPVSKHYEKLIPEHFRSDGSQYMTKELLQLLQRKTNTNAIGFFLSGMTIGTLRDTYQHPANQQNATLWNDHGYCIQYGIGYKVHYTINTHKLRIKTPSLQKTLYDESLDSNVAGNVVKAWKKNIASVLKNRAMLTNFIQQIA